MYTLFPQRTALFDRPSVHFRNLVRALTRLSDYSQMLDSLVVKSEPEVNLEIAAIHALVNRVMEHSCEWVRVCRDVKEGVGPGYVMC